MTDEIRYRRIDTRQYVIANAASYDVLVRKLWGASYNPADDGPCGGPPTEYPAVVTFYGYPTTTMECDITKMSLDDYRKELNDKLAKVADY